MRRIADTLRVKKVSRINLKNFFSIDVLLTLKAVNNSDVFVGISFLRNETALFPSCIPFTDRSTPGKWYSIDYSIHCGQDLDAMRASFTALSSVVNIAKLSFVYKGNKEPSCSYGLYCPLRQDDEDSPVEVKAEESSDELPITADFSDGYMDNDEMSEVESDSNESDGGEREEEELKEFSVNTEGLVTLCNLLGLQMPSEVFLIYLISLQFISFLCSSLFR